MDRSLEKRYVTGELAERAGGYFAIPAEVNVAYAELLFEISAQFGIYYYSASIKSMHLWKK